MIQRSPRADAPTPPSAAARRPAGRAAARGFTLVEVLVVVVIIGVLLTFATLSVGDRASSDALDNEAQRLEQLFRLAQEEAELKGQELGFRYTELGYQFLQVGREGRWVTIAEGPLRARPLPAPLEMSLRVEGHVVPPAQAQEAPAARTDAAARTASGSEAALAALQSGANDETSREEDEDAAAALRPQVLILSSGELSAFALELAAPGVDASYRISGTVIGQLSRERIEAADRR